MRCTEAERRTVAGSCAGRHRRHASRGWVAAMGAVAAVAVLAVLVGCAPTAPRPSVPAPTSLPAPATARGPAPVASSPAAPNDGKISPPSAAASGADAAATRDAAVDRGPIPREPRYVKLPPPPAPLSETALRVQLAQRLLEAHPDSSYSTRSPERLLAIPVLEIDLNADGSVRSIKVLRKPTTGNEATVLAIAAVRRAAPYGDVSRLPKPWRVVETFLFDDHLRFKPRTLDLD